MKKLYFMLFVVVCVALVVVYLMYNQSNLNSTLDDEFTIQLQLYDSIKPTVVTDTETTTTTDYLSQCDSLNPNAVAWLSIPDTPIDFPVVQSTDNEYYLSHDINNESSTYGVPFLDYRCSSDFSDFNSIIYGHNINGGRMFADLLNFQKKSYFESHPTGYLTTKDKYYQINFIACLVLQSDDFVYNVSFVTPNERDIFIQDIQAKCVQYREFSDVNLSDTNLITLSTCSYEFENARTILIGYLCEYE
jgi:sortase B